MISTTTRTANSSETTHSVAPPIDLDHPRSAIWRIRICRVRAWTRNNAVALLRTFGHFGNPGFFEFERRRSAPTRLGPGISREPDSFWPLVDW
jgi:hypothetical protein